MRINMVRTIGVEPIRLAALEPKSSYCAYFGNCSTLGAHERSGKWTYFALNCSRDCSIGVAA